MPSQKITTEPIKQLMVELPLSEYQVLEDYCRQQQETKRAVIRGFIRRLKPRLAKKENQ